MFDIDDLHAFVEAADRGTFTAAAQALSMTQPSLSRRIARLEREVGARLFDRSNRRAPRLAPAGEALLPHARQLLKEHDRFAEVSHAHTRGLEGIVTIALSDVGTELVLPSLYRYVSRRFPRQQLRILELAPGPAVRSAVLEREADIGFADGGYVTEELDSLVFGVAQQVAVGASEFLGYTNAPIEWEELRRLPLLLPRHRPQSGFPVGTDFLDVVQEAVGQPLLRVMAKSRLGVAILPGTLPAHGLQARPVVLDGEVQRTAFHLVWPSGIALSTSAARLVHDLRKRLEGREPVVLEEDRATELL